MSYTIREEGIGEIIEKKSVFTGRIKRVTSEEEARVFIEAVRKQERGARHNVFAYIIGEAGTIIRYSDDGEPQGTGGQPVLHVLTEHELTDVCLVVTRYFGGILLGAPGLTRAYSKAAAEAAASVPRWMTGEGAVFSVELPYDVHARLKVFLDSVQSLGQDFGQRVTLTLIAPADGLDRLQAELTDVSQGQAIFTNIRRTRCFIRDDGYLEEIQKPGEKTL